jgi:hypothetical protein
MAPSTPVLGFTRLSAVPYLLAIVTAAYVLYSIITVLKSGLRKLPGPKSARYSRLYRLSLVAGGRAPYEYQKLHQTYGPIVQTGPNHVSVTEPSAIPQIYGIGSHFLKVRRKV